MLTTEFRSGLYAMFSDFFAFPVRKDNLLFDREVLAEAAALLDSDAPPTVGDGQLLELQTAYTGLFINRPGGVQAPPYGSVYLETEPLLMGESTRAVLAVYREAGVNPEDSAEPPDALSLELEFMAHLADQEARARKDGNLAMAEELLRRQGSFCREYLHPWVFDFCQRVTGDETAHPLYRWGAHLLECFSRTEELYLSGQSA